MTESKLTESVAVIGAGWAGLAAALYLAERGVKVQVFDAAPQAGGRARRLDLALEQQNFVLDNGQHLLVGAYRDTLRIIANLGCEKLVQRVPLQLSSSAGLRLKTLPLPAPFHLLAGLLSCRGLALADRLRMLRLMLALRLAGWKTSETTVANLLRALKQGQPLIESIWRPLCVATLNTDIEVACAQTFVNVLRDTLGGRRADSDFVLSTVSLGDLFAIPAVARIERLRSQVHFRAPIRSLNPVPGGWALKGSAQGIHMNADMNTVFDQVILAVPPGNALTLLGEHGALAAFRATLGRFEYEPIVTTYLWWDEQVLQASEHPLPLWIQLQESIESDCFGQWLFDRGVQHGQRIAGVVVSAAARALLLGSDREGAQQSLGESIAIQVATQLRLPLPHTHRTIVEKRATFRCTPDRPKIYANALHQQAPGLWLAGDYVWPDYPATLEGAVRSGEAAAKACIEVF